MGCANVNDNWSSDTKLFPKSAAAKGISLDDFGNVQHSPHSNV